jgi:hypothetical protein
MAPEKIAPSSLRILRIVPHTADRLLEAGAFSSDRAVVEHQLSRDRRL